LFKTLQGIVIVDFDVENEVPIRDANGFCRKCRDNEAGEMLIKIRDDPSSKFAGYSDPSATEKKIISNVFVKGDKYFRTGDLLRQVCCFVTLV
jgi:fatty-acyl-CoA synthase